MAGKRVAQPQPKKRGRAVLLLFLIVILLLAGGVYGLCRYVGGYTAIFPGVSAAGIPLAGLSEEEARAALEQQAPALLQSSTVEVLLDGKSLAEFDLQQLHVSADTDAAAAAAARIGREEGQLMTAVRFVQAYLGAEQTVSIPLAGNEDGLRALIDELAAGVDVQPVDASWDMSEEGLFAVKQIDGRRVDQDALYRLLAEPVSLGSRIQVDCPVETLPAKTLDLTALTAELSGSVSNARYNPETGLVEEGSIGVSMDPDAAAYVLAAAAGGQRVQLPAEVVYPTLWAKDLQGVLFRDLLASVSTSVSGSSARRGNVKLAGESVNGTVLNDTDIFDYNVVVGERTAERGYGAAASYINGQTVDTIGGGICQVSSTVYKAALLSNLEIVERYAHRFYPGYIDLGMDATVSWGGPEFRFRNNTGYPIRIETVYKNNTLTVNIYGTKTDDTYVKMTYEVLGTTGYETEYVESADLAPGQQKEKQNGYTGYEVISYRNVYDGSGNLISSTQEAKSSYKNRNQIILVGPAAAPEAAAPAPSLPPADSGSTETGGSANIPDEPTLPDEETPPGWL